MKKYRNLTKQCEGTTLAFDQMTRLFSRKVTIDDFVRLDSSNLSAVNTAKKAVMMQERMQHIVYCLKVNNYKFIMTIHRFIKSLLVQD